MMQFDQRMILLTVVFVAFLFYVGRTKVNSNPQASPYKWDQA